MDKNAFFMFLMLSFGSKNGHAYEVDTYDILMPNVWPHRDELYLCTPIRISPDDNFYIVGFEPDASMHTAHHMLLYGCSEPGANDIVWGCGEMQNDNDGENMYTTASPCQSGSQIVYAWARDAPSLTLPQDVGFLVGKDSPIKYLVLQVHYMHRFPKGQTDKSGVYLKYTKHPKKPVKYMSDPRGEGSVQVKAIIVTTRVFELFEYFMPRQAGVILLGTGGVIAPQTVEHMETACTLTESKTIHPFAFRTHTHALGNLVSGYVVHRNETNDEWRLLGKKNPQLPQMFYPVLDQSPITQNDVLAARCTMDNPQDHLVKIGPTNKDEMCNFYLMYWVENDTPLEKKYCFTAGPPRYYWSKAPEDFNWIPDKTVSNV